MAYDYESVLDMNVLPRMCDLGPYMNWFTGLFRVWMIYHFSDQNRIKIELLKTKIWSEDPFQSQIAIEAHSSYKTELTETRPGIIIKRQKWTRVRIGIADRLMGALPADGSENYFNTWQGSHTLFCIAGTPGEAEELASEVFKDLNEFAPAVRKATDLFRLEVAEIGEYGILEESGKNFVVPVSVGYVLGETWILRQEAPFLKSIDLTLMGL